MSHLQTFAAPALVLLAGLYLIKDQLFAKSCGSGGCGSCATGGAACPVKRLEAVRVSLDRPQPPDREA